MSNKKIFKELYSKKINKDNNFKTILESIEMEKMKKKNSIVKWALGPVCLMLVICGVLFFNRNTTNINFKPSNLIINKDENYEIYINTIENENIELLKCDVDLKRVNYYMIPYFDFLTNLHVPDDFDNKEDFRVIYVKSDIKSDDYNILNNYELWCRNTKNNREIYIAFSDKYKPIRDYFFGGNGKVSKINNVELTIYKYKNSYMTTFTYNNINFDIETHDITEKELIELLTSIIK